MKLDPVKDCAIDLDDIQGELRDNPLKIYRYGLLYAASKAKAIRTEQYVKEVKGAAYRRIKEEIGKITEKALEAEINVDDEVKDAYSDMADAQQDMATYFETLKALKAKQESLITLSANNRAETK
jgi:hypothetical protein